MRGFCPPSLSALALRVSTGFFLRCAQLSPNRTAVTAVALETQNPKWVSSNSLYRRHPRLLSLEERSSSPRHRASILAYAIVSGLFRNPFVVSRILHLLCSGDQPDMSYAVMVFTHMEKPNTFSWNTIIRGFVESEVPCPSIALSYYQQMLERRVAADKYTYPFLLKACRSASRIVVGKLLHVHCLVSGFSMDVFVQTALVNMYLGCGCIENAQKLFDGMPKRDVISWTSVISGLTDGGYFERALELFNSMRKEDFSARPNAVTMVSVMSACAGLGSSDSVRSLHAHLEKTGFVGNVVICNSLIDVYAKCGSLECSYNLFNLMEEKDFHSWTAIIMGLATHGMATKALDLFAKMKCSGVVPDSVTFIAVLSACSHAGLVNEGLKNFESMERDYKIVPEMKHYGCMVDLFSRAGLLEDAYRFISTMPVKPNLAVLGALLSSCRDQNKLKLAEAITKVIETSCEDKGGAHVLLSNMYADEKKWCEVSLIRKSVIGDTRKPPGHSGIEVKGVVHKFMVGHKSHPDFREMSCILDSLGKTVHC